MPVWAWMCNLLAYTGINLSPGGTVAPVHSSRLGEELLQTSNFLGAWHLKYCWLCAVYKFAVSTNFTRSRLRYIYSNILKQKNVLTSIFPEVFISPGLQGFTGGCQVIEIPCSSPSHDLWYGRVIIWFNRGQQWRWQVLEVRVQRSLLLAFVSAAYSLESEIKYVCEIQWHKIDFLNEN